MSETSTESPAGFASDAPQPNLAASSPPGQSSSLMPQVSSPSPRSAPVLPSPFLSPQQSSMSSTPISSPLSPFAPRPLPPMDSPPPPLSDSLLALATTA